jgi:biopolymer transport protein ExbB
MVVWVRRRLVPVLVVVGVWLALAPDVFAQGAVTPAIGNLPRDLSAWGMFQTADFVVKLVLIGLAFASLLTWTVAIAKGREVLSERQRLAGDYATLLAASSLASVAAGLDPRKTAGRLVEAAVTEIEMSPSLAEREGIKERIASRLGRIEAAFGRAMIRGTGALATIGATAPFVGLFGTVWGIMNSFIGISKMQTTNLAVVAPGIAEALLATAAGLVVAIPAVVIYNVFSRGIAVNRAMCADAAAAVLRLASRDLERPDARSGAVNEGAPVVVRRQRP